MDLSSGVTLFIGVMKVDSGSGGPARVLAVIGDPAGNYAAISMKCYTSLMLISLLLIFSSHYIIISL